MLHSFLEYKYLISFSLLNQVNYLQFIITGKTWNMEFMEQLSIINTPQINITILYRNNLVQH